MLKHLGLDGWQAWDYAVARLYKRTETPEGVSNMCDVCGSPNGKEHGATCPIAIAEALMVRELRKCQAGHRKPVVYVAGRFRSADGWKINENVFAAEKAGREVAALGAMPLVPHSIGTHMAGTEDDTFWLTGTLELMRRCDAVLVLPGYQESQGAMGEIAEAQRIGMPVIMPIEGQPDWESLVAYLKTEKPLGVLSTCKQCGGWGETGYKVLKKECSACKGTGKARNHQTPESFTQEKKVTLDVKEDPNSYDTHSWWQLRNAAQRQNVGRLELAVEDACLFDGQVLTVEREHGKSEVALHTVDESGECYIWLKDDSAICKLISALSLLAQGEGPVALMAEIAEKWQTKRLIDARDKADQTLAELGIELGQREGETLLAAVAEKLRDALAANRDTQRAEVRKLQALLALCRNERDRVADVLGCPKEGVEESVKAVVEERNALRGDLATAWDERDRAMAAGDLRYDCHGGPGTTEPACGACVTCLLRVNEQLTAERDGLKQELERCGNAFMQSMKDRSEKANELRADKEAFARDATRVRLALESEVKDLKERLAAVTTQLTIVDKGYDEALELCDRDGMTPAEQIKELRKELEDIRPEAEQMAGWRQSSLDRQVEIQNLQAELAEEKKQRQDFIAALCAELGVEGGQRTVMVALEQLKSRLDTLRTELNKLRAVRPRHITEMAKTYQVRAFPLVQPSEQSPSPEASHITQAGEAVVKKALTRPADSSCTCHQNAPCSHCTWYADRGLSEPEEAASGLVMQD